MDPQNEHTEAIPVDRTSSWPSDGGGWWGPDGRFGGGAAGDRRDDDVSWGESQPPPPPRRGTGAALLAGALALGLLGGVAGSYGVQKLATPGDAAPVVLEATPAVMPGSAEAVSGSGEVTAIAQLSLPSVVFISVEAGGETGVGSGFVMSADGYIVTNSHVIASAADGEGGIEVKFSDGQTLPAEVVGHDVQYDIAVLRVDREGLAALQFGDSDAVLVGAPVVAVGAPLGLSNTVTAGIVSALDRPVTAGTSADSLSYINAIQTDAAINPGNSGGPLLDAAGRVIGVNSALAQLPGPLGTAPGGSIGLGFAIPSNQVQRTATQLIETGSSEHPIIGVLIDTTYTDGGAKIRDEPLNGTDSVIEGGPADEAGIVPGEVIVAIDGLPIDSFTQLVVTLRDHDVGDTIEATVRGADGTERTVTMVLQGSSD